ncbi:MAG: hypothetical protein M3R68_04255 [Acidobacteriota bacterium]|nr:hypothetical protein [Acidobacteriota bacterium]
MKWRVSGFMRPMLAILFLLGMFVVTTVPAGARDRRYRLCLRACTKFHRAQRARCNHLSGHNRQLCIEKWQRDVIACKDRC